MKKLMKVMLTSLLALSLVACASPKEEGFEGGTFSGSAQGFAGDVAVEVTLDAEKVITNIEVTSAESPEVGEKAIPVMVEEMLANNTIEVDTVQSATISSEALLAACAAALESAGLTNGDLKTVEGNGTAADTTLEADVVIVGAGGAGMVAALTATEAGKSVIIVEKAAIVGGNSARATGGMNAAETEYQNNNEFGENAGVEKMLANAENYPELAELAATVAEQYEAYQANPEGYFDSVELFELDTMVGGKGLNNLDLVKTLAENSSDAIDWLGNLATPVILHDVASFGGASVKRIHRPVNDEGKTVSVGAYTIPLLEENVNNAGVTVLTNTEATEILMNDGTACGVVATSGSTTYTINAKAVVLTTGGFGGNLPMVAEIKPDLDGFISTNATTCTGDGIKMATAVGANTVDMEQIQIHPTVLQSNGALITEGLRGDGAILVNQNGERFCDEVGTRDAVSAAELAQEGGYAYLIVDQKMIDASAVIQGYITKDFSIGGNKDDKTGTDLETLAGLMEVDAETLTNTINAWNECVANKEDAEFGRTSFANPLEDAYIAIKIAPGVHHTMGGVEINTNAEVIDTNGAVIPGLFAAGEVTGGVHGANRLGGNAVADFVVFGRIAGASASEFAK